LDLIMYSRAKAKQMLDFYIEAETRVLSGKSITKDGRTWTRENLVDIRKGRQEWETIYRNLSPGRSSGMRLAEF